MKQVYTEDRIQLEWHASTVRRGKHVWSVPVAPTMLPEEYLGKHATRAVAYGLMPDEPLDDETKRAAASAGGSRKRRVFQISLVIGIIFFLSSILISSLNRARQRTGQVPCASDLRQIGQAILLYCYDGNAHYPPDLATLVRTQGLSPEVLICPSSDDTPASSPAQCSQPGHCSYIYVGSSLTWSKSSAALDAIVAFEDPAIHDLEGASVLYDDGHVNWVFLPDLMTAL